MFMCECLEHWIADKKEEACLVYELRVSLCFANFVYIIVI